jgi:hypothetical protein
MESDGFEADPLAAGWRAPPIVKGSAASADISIAG